MVSKHSPQAIIISAFRQALDKEINEVALLLSSLFPPTMQHNLYFLAIKLDHTALCNSCIRHLLRLKLNESEFAGFSIWVNRELARLDSSELPKGLTQLLLRHLWMD